jgi:predicted RNA-binding protein with TRAM domain
MPALDDGVYDVLIVDAQEVGDGGVVKVELVVITGAHKGEVVPLRVTHFDGDLTTMLGLPGVLTVTNGTPSFALE